MIYWLLRLRKATDKTDHKLDEIIALIKELQEIARNQLDMLERLLGLTRKI